MSIDLSQFKQTFLEESDEGLDVLESGLLALDSGSADEDVIHAVFRAAHSIKGGAGTFGLNEIASFTHIMETLLDEMRDGRREITQEAITALLNSVDVLRDMLEAAAEDVPPPMENAEQVTQELEAILNGVGQATIQTTTQATTNEQVVDEESVASVGWKVFFKPMEHMLRTGNDTVRILRELSALGEIKLTSDTSEIPDFSLMDPELSYISWNAELTGEISKEQITEIFEWVDEDCELVIEPFGEAKVEETAVPEAVAVAAETVQVAPETTAQPATVQSEPAAQPVAAKKERKKEGGSIRVGTDKVDELINMVGELVITQSMLSQMGSDFSMQRLEDMREGLSQLERNTRELQESVMRIRMLPISFSFQRFPRLVHDLSSKMGKKIELKLSGEQTELDKTVMEKIGDPLVHLVRNSLDHGIEKPEVRVEAGKPETGTIHLNAYHQGGHIMIEITDDGAGLPKDKLLAKAIKQGLTTESEGENMPDDKIYDFIFHPGFSTAETVSDVSGRGVGMDVVRKNIKELGGNIELSSEWGKGTKFTIRLPLTLAILDGQLLRIGDEVYIIPLVSIIESVEIDPSQISSIAGGNEVYKLRDEYIPLLHLDKMFRRPPRHNALEDSLMVVVEGDTHNLGIIVDDLLTQQQVVIKSLESNYKRVEGISGATILGDGTVALILDMMGLIAMSQAVDAPHAKAS
ncbi:MAG: chemotaxis protein CheA [Gammaproteobacteria bacterium]|nr:chemotaxis protein CheA [Gammaproteobacteria bacterium]